jgi:ribonuclease D
MGFSWHSGDEKKMRNTFGVGKDMFSNFCDVQDLAADLGYSKNCGLSTLTRYVLNAKLPKSNRISRSDWERKELSSAQIMYAALDVLSLHAVVQRWRDLLVLSNGCDQCGTKLAVPEYKMSIKVRFSPLLVYVFQSGMMLVVRQNVPLGE